MSEWKPRNLDGRIDWDPRRALQVYVDRARRDHEEYVAVPIDLLQAAARVRECGARTMLTADEDGPLPEPVEIQCRHVENHDQLGIRMHYNGYTHWEPR